MRGRTIIVLLSVALVLATATAFFAAAWFHRYAHSPLNPDVGALIIDIPRGSAFVQIVGMLEREGLVDNRNLFYLLARLKKVHQDLKAGEYELSGMASPLEVLDKLSRGEVKVHWVSIPEGLNMLEVADRFASRGLADYDRLVSLMQDSAFLASLGIEAESAEGYLYPDTYPMTRAKTEETIIRFMVRRFRAEVGHETVREAERLGLTLHELITLASIVEKEAAVKDEMPIISAVFHNRLKRGMRLQSDPTVIYGVEGFEGRIRRRDLERETPYNTYRIRALPPGPICNPGIAAIQATLNPASVNYLYFVSRNDGTHQFSTNLSDHNRAVRKYQIERRSN